MEHAGPTLLQSAFVFLAAAVISVPLAKRLGLGSVLGYLVAGIVIGPHALGFVGSAEGAADVMATAEFGIVIMLFLIGLELQPARLWAMRVSILGMGGAQVALVTAAFTAVGVFGFGLAWPMALAIGLALSQSSTAIVLTSLRERGIVNTDAGRGGFAVLLFQDLSLIPMLAVIPLLATLPAAAGASHASGLIADLPGWAQALAVAGAVGAIVLAGRVVLRPVFRWIAATGLHEIFTAFALALVVGVALLMQAVGLSPALGAFVAGVVLADSEFRHEIEGDIDPFRGLLLGLFFISVGASIDLPLVTSMPLVILGLAVGAIALKGALSVAVAWAFRNRPADAAFIGAAVAETGEFALVLLPFGVTVGAIAPDLVQPLMAVVVVSMMLTPLLLIGADAAAKALLAGPAVERAPEIDQGPADVIVAGYGRFGQVVGRLLAAQGKKVSVLDHDADQVELLRGFGRKVNYGDATRMELLRLAGAADARLLVIAIDDSDKALDLAARARAAFPHLKIVARAYDRRSVYRLRAAGVDVVERETFAAAVRLGVKALRALGKPAFAAERAGKVFTRFDERMIDRMYQNWRDLPFGDYQRVVRDATALEEEILRQDNARQGAAPDGDQGWETDALDAAQAADQVTSESSRLDVSKP